MISDGKGPVRGESDADVEVEEVEDDEDVEYVADEHAVRYVATLRYANSEEVEEGEEPEYERGYEIEPFDQWAETECLWTAAGRAADHANDELDTDEVGGGVTSAVEGRDLAAYVSVETVLDRDGDPISEASVAFEDLVAATPATVHATYRLADQSYEMDVPVYATYSVAQQE